MIDEPLDEQASLYALGALPPEEAAAFEAQMAVNDELRRHVDSLTDAVAQIAYAAPARALPPHLEASILEQIRGAKITPITSAARRATWIPWAIAACLAIACLLTFADRQRVAMELTQARSDNTETQSQLAALATDKERASSSSRSCGNAKPMRGCRWRRWLMHARRRRQGSKRSRRAMS
jgi:anti-sigma-K factor RskA